MNESEKKMIGPEQELVDLLLDFIIVAARLAKNINLAVKEKRSMEGGNGNGKTQRIGSGNQRPAHGCCGY